MNYVLKCVCVGFVFVCEKDDDGIYDKNDIKESRTAMEEPLLEYSGSWSRRSRSWTSCCTPPRASRAPRTASSCMGK